MKKLSALMLALALCFSLAACAPKDDTDENAETKTEQTQDVEENDDAADVEENDDAADVEENDDAETSGDDAEAEDKDSVDTMDDDTEDAEADATDADVPEDLTNAD